ncbi:MAG: sigma-70 family RNA polymerase sigma factor [Omnitrophica bacterium]|nr:sigma-70 family RNA polymerase sigma factor [Candidatus Omnitrophota bacterium]
MDFETLYNRLAPILKKIATSYKARGAFIDQDDLYQEMTVHLWKRFGQGVPFGVNESYIIQGCKFHIFNYLRKNREKTVILSLERSRTQDGSKLEDVLSCQSEPLSRCLERKTVFEEIRNNGFTKREKEVLTYLVKGFTVREVGGKLGISHVMIVKYKNRIIKKWRRKNKGYQR